MACKAAKIVEPSGIVVPVKPLPRVVESAATPERDTSSAISPALSSMALAIALAWAAVNEPPVAKGEVPRPVVLFVFSSLLLNVEHPARSARAAIRIRIFRIFLPFLKGAFSKSLRPYSILAAPVPPMPREPVPDMEEPVDGVTPPGKISVSDINTSSI